MTIADWQRVWTRLLQARTPVDVVLNAWADWMLTVHQATFRRAP